MAQTTVYGCDWCGDIVDRDKDGEPKFAAKIVARMLNTSRPRDPDRYQICTRCLNAFRALTEGRYRR